MIGKSLLITHLLRSLKKIKNDLSGLGDCYLFGSVLTQENPRDIDILIIYDHYKINLTSVSLLKKKLRQSVERDLDKKVDLCTLSKSEAVQSNFVVEEKCQFLLSL